MDKIEYKTKGITVIWQPSKCTHSGVCVKMLPDVYHPKDKPWITADKANAATLKNQIEHCPSGALSYRLENNNDIATD